MESAFKILDSLTKKIFVKNNKKIITDPDAEKLRIRSYEAADDLETVRSIINDAYVRVHDKLGLQRVVRIPSVEDIASDNLYLATLGREVVGAMIVTPTSDGALIGHILFCHILFYNKNLIFFRTSSLTPRQARPGYRHSFTGLC